jgi:hypothetical protein
MLFVEIYNLAKGVNYYMNDNNLLVFFPTLKLSERDREYNNYPELIRDKIVYQYLFQGKTPRWLDENIIGIIFMGIICGAIFGATIYGRKSILTFSAVCGLVSFSFGILVGFFNSGHPIKATFENLFAVFGPIDLNFLAIITSFGVGIGLSIGLFSMLKQKSTEKGTM